MTGWRKRKLGADGVSLTVVGFFLSAVEGLGWMDGWITYLVV